MPQLVGCSTTRSKTCFCPAAGLQDRKGHQAICPDGTQPAAETADGKRAKAGIVGAPIRLMIVGIPNVGKSSFINRMAQSKKGKRWKTVRCHPYQAMGENRRPDGIAGYAGGFSGRSSTIEEVAKRLAFTGAIKDDIMDLESLAMLLLEFLAERYPKALEARYKMQVSDADSGLQLLEQLGRKRGC